MLNQLLAPASILLVLLALACLIVNDCAASSKPVKLFGTVISEESNPASSSKSDKPVTKLFGKYVQQDTEASKVNYRKSSYFKSQISSGMHKRHQKLREQGQFGTGGRKPRPQ